MTCPTSWTPSPRSLPECISMTAWEFGLVTSIFAVGGLCGALASQPIGNRYGRRTTLAINSLGFVLAGIIKSLATDVSTLALGRFISGMGSGAACVVVPLYVNEVAPLDAKGKLCVPPTHLFVALYSRSAAARSRRSQSTLAS